MGFQTIRGHQKIIETLQHAVQNNRVHHAYLFFGPAGVGKRSVAQLMGRALLCEKHDGDACDSCSSCVRMMQRIHPDYFILGEDRSQPQIKVDEIREQLLRFLSLRAHDGGHRVVIIQDAERLNLHAANALLKTLEEPPPHTTFILTTRNIQHILITVRSRCQKIRFHPLHETHLIHYLLAEQGRTEEEARLLARIAGGSVGMALGFTTDQLTKRHGFLTLIAGLGGETDPVLAASNFAEDRTISYYYLSLLDGFLRDALVQAVGAGVPLTHPDHRTDSGVLARRMSVSALCATMASIQELRTALRVNITPQNVMERLFLDLAKALRTIPGVELMTTPS